MYHLCAFLNKTLREYHGCYKGQLKKLDPILKQEVNKHIYGKNPNETEGLAEIYPIKWPSELKCWSSLRISSKSQEVMSLLAILSLSSSCGHQSWGVFSHLHDSPLPPCCQTTVLTDGEWECVQIQTVKTQEMNLLREQQEALTAELSQRRAEYEALSAQRDDLASQLQVSTPTPQPPTHTHTRGDGPDSRGTLTFEVKVLWSYSKWLKYWLSLGIKFRQQEVVRAVNRGRLREGQTAHRAGWSKEGIHTPTHTNARAMNGVVCVCL